MKHLLILPFLILALFANGQITKPSQPGFIPPAFFLDSVRVPMYTLYDPEKIGNISIPNGYGYDEASKTQGRIYITSKDPSNFVFLTLPEVAAKYAKTKETVLYMINTEIIKDIQDVKIDSSYILKCEMLSTKDIDYLKDLPSMTILNIITKTKANIARENTVFIR